MARLTTLWKMLQMAGSKEKALILDFLKKHSLCVLATTDSSGKPEAAIIQFLETNAFELIFETLRTNRKVKNLLKNHNVAVVFGGDGNKTVQYEGTAKRLSAEEFSRWEDAYLSKYPKSGKWIRSPDITYFKIEPKWIRYYDSSIDPTYIFEINAF